MLGKALRYAGHEVVLAHNGTEALQLFGPEADLDVVLMDIGLPDADGRDVCQALKSAGQHAPVLFLTALGGQHDRCPVSMQGPTTTSPSRSTCRSCWPGSRCWPAADPPRARAGGLVLDPTSHAVRTSHGEVMLTPTEFRMLAAITSRPGEVVRRRAVVAAAWPDGALVQENTIDAFMGRLRRKLASVSSPVGIETVRGIGYRLR